MRHDAAHHLGAIPPYGRFGDVVSRLARVGWLAGLAGSVAVVAVVAAFETDGTLVGASAAVFGVAAAVLVVSPSSRILGGTATQWLTALIAINVVLLLSEPIGSVAHLTGLAVGAMYGALLKRRARRNAERSVLALLDESV